MDRTEPPATPEQLAHLGRHGIPYTWPLSQRAASALISRAIGNWRRRAATPRQQGLLRQLGLWKPGLSRGEASDLIDRALGR